jgi:CubicO group peptidase (beta-lactamase class C family)
MARLDRRILLRIAGAGMAVACACVVTACVGTPGPGPSELIDAELEKVFAVVQGEEAVRAILVSQHGDLVFEEYRDAAADEAWDVREITATVTSTLIGIAIDEGLIEGVDVTLDEALPDHRDVLTPETESLTLHELMTHTANFPARGETVDFDEKTDWVGAVLEDRAARGPGDEYGVSDEGAHVLAGVVAESTGMSPLTYARQKLFDPIGIDTEGAWQKSLPPDVDADLGDLLREYENAPIAWPADPSGVNIGGDSLRLRPTDLLRLGQLFLDDGHWNDQPVVSAEWVSQATWPIVETRSAISPFVGYGWGVNDEAGIFLTRGTGGTVIVVHPEKDAVVVIASEIASDDPRGSWGVMTVSVLALAMALVNELPAG